MSLKRKTCGEENIGASAGTDCLEPYVLSGFAKFAREQGPLVFCRQKAAGGELDTSVLLHGKNELAPFQEPGLDETLEKKWPENPPFLIGLSALPDSKQRRMKWVEVPFVISSDLRLVHHCVQGSEACAEHSEIKCMQPGDRWVSIPAGKKIPADHCMNAHVNFEYTPLSHIPIKGSYKEMLERNLRKQWNALWKDEPAEVVDMPRTYRIKDAYIRSLLELTSKIQAELELYVAHK